MTAPGAAPRRRNPDQLQRIMTAAMEAIAEHGLADLRMAHLAERTQMSHGHMLYYFGSKDRILLETLKWSENELSVERERRLSSTDDPLRRLREFIDLSLPSGPRDPHWILWLEIFARTPHDPDLLAFQRDYDFAWRRDLEQIVNDGVTTGVFAAVNVPEFVTWFTALTSGLAIEVVGCYPGSSRREATAMAKRVALQSLGVAE